MQFGLCICFGTFILNMDEKTGMKNKLTIADIAKALNISKITVSLVLNGKARQAQISKKLEERVMKYIEEVGYKPNLFAQGLRTGKTKIIGMLVEDISDPFFSSIARYAEEIAYNEGYKIVYCSTENNTKKTKEMLQVYRSQKIDGYIIAPPPGIEKEVNDLIKGGYPVVFFDRPLKGVNTDTVLVDNYQSTFDGTQHLIENGFKHIGFITLLSDQGQMLERLEGYHDAMVQADLEPSILKIQYHGTGNHSIKQIEEVLQGERELDALFCATNYIADNALEAIANLGLNIPKDLGIMVFDDQKMYKLFHPPITAITQPVKEISEISTNLLLKRLINTEESPSVQKVVLSTQLVVRKSTHKSEQEA